MHGQQNKKTHLPVSGNFLNYSTYEDWIDRLSRNVSNQLPIYAT